MYLFSQKCIRVRILSSLLNVFSPAATYVSSDSAPYTDELFIENRDLCEFPRHVLVNFNFVLLKSQFRSNILLKSGQDFVFSQMTKIWNSQMTTASHTCRHEIYRFCFARCLHLASSFIGVNTKIILFYSIVLFIIRILCCEQTSSSITFYQKILGLHGVNSAKRKSVTCACIDS